MSIEIRAISDGVAAASKDSPARIGKAATDFEALLIAQMLRSNHTDEDDSQENSTMMDMAEQQFAQTLATNGGFGIAKMVVAGLTKHADR
jgi:Rod binding domain-containing protein